MKQKFFKTNSGITRLTLILIVILIIVVIALATFGIYTFIKNNSSEDDSTDDSPVNIPIGNYNNVDDSKNNTTNNSTSSTGVQYNRDDLELVLNGFKFTIPSDFTCSVSNSDESFSVANDDNTIHMIFKVTDGSYDKASKDTKALTDAAENSGYTVGDVQEESKNGIKCLYFECSKSNDKFVIAYTKGNNDKKFGMLAEITDSNVNEALDMFITIAKTATETTESNTTSNNLMNQITKPGATKSSSSLSIGGTSLDFKVPSGFYSLSTDEYSFQVSELFVDSNNYISVDVKIETTPLGSAEDFLEVISDSASDHDKFKTSGVKSIKVAGKEFKYVEFSYVLPAKNDGSYLDSDIYQKYIYVVYDISENRRFSVRADTLFADRVDLSIDTIKDFLDISGI